MKTIYFSWFDKKNRLLAESYTRVPDKFYREVRLKYDSLLVQGDCRSEKKVDLFQHLYKKEK